METVDDGEWAARGKTLVQVVITVITVIGIIIAIMNIFSYLIIVIFFTLTQFLENKIYTQKTRKLRQNTQ